MRNSTIETKTAVCICCHDDYYHLAATIRSFSSLPVYVCVSTVAWDGSIGDYQKCIDVATEAGATVILGTHVSEKEHREAALREMRERGVKWLFTVDGDEVIERRLLDTLLKLAATGVYDLFRVHMYTYWKSVRYRIHPPENLAPVVLINTEVCEHVHIREYSGDLTVTLGFEHGALMHLSYVGPDERIQRKIETWGHRTEVVGNWYENVWLAWDKDRTMRNVHPTHPECYGFAERIKVPEVLKSVVDERPALLEPGIPKNWLKISVVIALYGGEFDIERCLESLRVCGVKGKRGKNADDSRPALLHEVIVVDDCSPDGAAEIAARYPFVKLIRNKENLGFGGSNNKGIEASTGDAVLILNSDTIVPRAGLISLGLSLMSSGTIGAVGPLTNNCGYFQAISPTYTDIKNLERFACDFSHRDVPDGDESMVVGFALLVRRSVLDEVGLFDSRYGRALFEDTDLVHRIKRAGYKTLVCHKAYIHHEGSKSLARVGEHPSLMLGRNRRVYENKWKLDLETGYVSHLTGLAPQGRLTFNSDREPSAVIEGLKKLAHQEGICVCIIAKNEERCIGDALDSLLKVFPQVIVLDTGSTDRTMEIAREKGAEVYEMEWPDSFAEARNQSMRYAKGKWVFWIDCDDTVPFRTLETVIHAAASAPQQVNGFIIPVQFVGSSAGEGTRVDHVKLFRKDPRHLFEGRIHENIVGSLRDTGGQIDRLDCVVLHSNYDLSPEGQRKKRIRDRYLLALDLKDRPGHPFVLFNLGMTAFYLGRFKVALGWLRRSIAISEGGESHLRKSFVLMGDAQKNLGRGEEAIRMYEMGLTTVGEDPELRFNLAKLLSELGRFEEARSHLLAMNPDTSGFYSSVDVGILGYKRMNLLASVCAAMGQETEAKQHLREGIRQHPYQANSAIALYEAGARGGDIVAMREAAEAIRNVQGHSEQWASMRAGIAELAGVDPDQELMRLTRELPQSMGPGLLLVRRQLQRGIVDIPLLSHLEGLGSAEAAHHLSNVERTRGDLEAARYHAAISLQLETANPQYLDQLADIEISLEGNLPPLIFENRKDVLVGPHVGKLGPASLHRSVVIVAFNSASLIEECLTRVLRSIGETDEVIVVDNASSDSTLSIVSALADPRLLVLPQAENLGYSKACNLGILASRGAQIALLNPDAFVEDCWLEKLGEALTPGVGAVGPVCDMVAGEQFVGQYIGDRRPRPGEISQILEAEQAGVTRPTKLLMGVCLLLSREVLELHGLLCEETDLGADDLELSWRLCQLGFKLKVVPSVFVHHVGGASFASLPSLERRKRIRRSDKALIRRLVAYYGAGKVPSSYELFGCDIFAEALAR